MGPFKPLSLSTLKPQTGHARPYFSAPNLVRPSSSALEVMTDLRYVAAETVRAGLDLEAATQRMIVRSVRSLLVVDAEGDVIGIVTARDLMSDRALAVAQQRGVEFGELGVRDVMTPGDHIEVMDIDDVLHARVGDIVETLKHSGRQHAMAVESDAIAGRPVIRGIFSASQIARQLGIALKSYDLGQTFAEIDRAMKSAA